MKRLLFILQFVTFCHVLPYQAKGTHYIATYKQCNDSLTDGTWTYVYFIIGIINSGATIMSHNLEHFSNNGITGTAVLAESHASIHTYPEHKTCFVDLFTCGDNCDWREFEDAMVKWIKPKEIQRKVMVRE